MLTLSAAFPSRSGKSSLTLRNRLGSEDSARGSAAKESARRTDSRELPAELARQQRSLWQVAVCTLHAAIHSPGAGAQLPRCECCANLWPTAPDRKTGKGCAIGRWPQPGPVWPDARLAPERFPRPRRLALSLALVGPARHRLRRRCSSFVRVWPFPPCGSERKRSQTLNLWTWIFVSNFCKPVRRRIVAKLLLCATTVATRRTWTVKDCGWPRADALFVCRQVRLASDGIF